MLIFWDQRLVFLATPKTGSTALTEALRPYASVVIERPPVLKHTPAQRYHRFVGPWLKSASGAEFSTVALMREPVSWLASWYRFRRRDDLAGSATSTLGLEFEAFVAAYACDPQPEYARVGAQARFLTPPGRQPVDHIFRYEAMDQLLAFFAARLGVVPEVPVRNVSPMADVQLSPGGHKVLERVLAADFALYASLS